MDPMNNIIGVDQQDRLTHNLQAMTHFEPAAAGISKIGTQQSQNLSQLHTVGSHDTISVVSKLFQFIDMDPMNDVWVAQQELTVSSVPSHDTF
jgi:hypothetical protein